MRKLQRGLTLLEMMIVLAIIALIMGVLVGPKLIGLFHHSQRDIAQMAVTKFADQDYPMWALQHPSTPCPSTLAEIEHKPPVDPWGVAYKGYCAPVTDVPFGAASFGDDRREATADDIRSWSAGE
jgi:prepilin-type N-terminal cleavage/methylation domain-containing protein